MGIQTSISSIAHVESRQHAPPWTSGRVRSRFRPPAPEPNYRKLSHNQVVFCSMLVPGIRRNLGNESDTHLSKCRAGLPFGRPVTALSLKETRDLARKIQLILALLSMAKPTLGSFCSTGMRFASRALSLAELGSLRPKTRSTDAKATP